MIALEDDTMPKKPSKKTVNFESSLKELEELVESMEQGDLSMEDSLKHFERGIALTRICQTALKEAEQKVHILMEQNDKLETEPFDNKE